MYEIEYYIENNKSPVYEFIIFFISALRITNLYYYIALEKQLKTPKGDLELATKRMKIYLQGSELK